MATIELTFATEAEFRSKFAATPADWVAAGNRYRFLQTKKEIVFASPITLEGKVTGPENDMEIAYVAGASYLDDPDILIKALCYDGSKGAAAAIAQGYIPGLFQIKMSYVKFTGYQMRQAMGTGGAVLKVFSGADFISMDRCILDGYGSSQYDWPLEINNATFYATNTVIVHNSNLAVAAYLNTPNATFENCTVIRPSNFTKSGYAFRLVNNGCTFINCAVFGFDAMVENRGAATVIKNCACSGTIGAGTGNLENILASDVFVNPVSDFRLKKVDGQTNPLMDVGFKPSTNNTRAINGVRQQGNAADIGAWETPSPLVAPTATVTNVVVNERSVTISGTTTGTPTAGKLSTQVANVAYNSAEAQGPFDLVIGDGVFSCVVPNNKLGEYNFTYEVENAAYKVAGSNSLGSFKVVGPVVTSMTQTLDGQFYKLSGVVTGSPLSGNVLLKASAGATGSDKTFNFVIAGNQFTIADGNGLLTAGKYDAGIVRFSTAAGTSQPQPGTSAITIQGLSGNPQMPDMEEVEQPPTVTGVNVTPETVTVEANGTVQLTSAVVGTNFPAQAVSYIAPKGTVSASGLFTAHAPTVDEVVTIVVTSIADTNFSDTCVVTVKAKVVVTPVPTVNTVTVTPATATTTGATVQLTAVAIGDNNPGQGMTWTAPKGTVVNGLFTPPARTSVEQTITVRATSTVNTQKYGEAVITVPALDVIDPGTKATTATITMVSPEGVAQANLTGLSCSFFDQTDIGDLLAPVARTKVGATDGLGKLTMNITGTTLVPGQSGRIIVGKGTKAFTGVVVVS